VVKAGIKSIWDEYEGLNMDLGPGFRAVGFSRTGLMELGFLGFRREADGGEGLVVVERRWRPRVGGGQCVWWSFKRVKERVPRVLFQELRFWRSLAGGSCAVVINQRCRLRVGSGRWSPPLLGGGVTASSRNLGFSTLFLYFSCFFWNVNGQKERELKVQRKRSQKL